MVGETGRFGAGDGNRTRMTSLEGWGSTIELHPRVDHQTVAIRSRHDAHRRDVGDGCHSPLGSVVLSGG